MTILVAGGSGTLGRQLVQRLVAQGSNVRILTRDPTRARLRAQGLVGPHVEFCAGDVRDPHSLVSATAGVNAVVSAVHGLLGTGGDSP
ncbi:MAG TPA: SDR family NAD(P)-dependent oxidoreductase, partial [Chloroflexota bacterium]|nr:SDR family NAD(P)-dependent oxidoreductase [Chloroflexota bacterium]